MRSHSAHVLLGEYASCVRCINSITLLCAQVCETCLSGLNCTSVKEEASSLRYPTLQSEHASGRYKTTYTPQTYTPQTYTPQTPNLHAPNQHAPNLHAPNQHAPNLHAPNLHAPNNTPQPTRPKPTRPKPTRPKPTRPKPTRPNLHATKPTRPKHIQVMQNFECEGSHL